MRVYVCEVQGEDEWAVSAKIELSYWLTGRGMNEGMLIWRKAGCHWASEHEVPLGTMGEREAVELWVILFVPPSICPSICLFSLHPSHRCGDCNRLLKICQEAKSNELKKTLRSLGIKPPTHSRERDRDHVVKRRVFLMDGSFSQEAAVCFPFETDSQRFLFPFIHECSTTLTVCVINVTMTTKVCYARRRMVHSCGSTTLSRWVHLVYILFYFRAMYSKSLLSPPPPIISASLHLFLNRLKSKLRWWSTVETCGFLAASVTSVSQILWKRRKILLDHPKL